MEKHYFLDSYALIEITKENENYKKFKETNNMTTLLNLFEVHYILSKTTNEETANTIIEKLSHIVIHFDIEDVKLASHLRMKFIKKKLSYIDCLGYAVSLKRRLVFVTGDKGFINLENVEFIK